MTLNRLFRISALFIVAVSLVSSMSARSKDEIRPLLISSKVPNVMVRNADGDRVSLESVLNEKRTIIIFYRGGWCPYCNIHLQELSGIESDLLALGYQIIAISPDSPERIKESSIELKTNYTLYSDANLAAADAFGISWNPSEKNLAVMKEDYGHDLVAYSGGKNTRSRLPVPAVFIVTPDSKISFNYVDPSKARYRIPGELLLSAAKTSLNFHEE